MTLKDIQERNQRFQQRTASLVDMIPGGGFLDVSTAMIRSARMIDKYLFKLVRSQSEAEFAQAMDLIEEELDEAVFILDRIDNKNRKYKLKMIDTFLKEGYDLLSIYSMCCDQLIGKRIGEEEDIL
ncbi:MAG: hypothetical protein RIF46_03255 [Cyclobacteriaceae bacterium]